MSFSYLKQLPTPEEIKQTYPLSEACQKIKQKRDAEIARVLPTRKNLSWIIFTDLQKSMSRPKTN